MKLAIEALRLARNRVFASLEGEQKYLEQYEECIRKSQQDIDAGQQKIQDLDRAIAALENMVSA